MPAASHQISVAVSNDLLDALDVEAFRQDEPRSATIRRILADHLRETGVLKRTAPVTFREGQNSHLYRPKGGRA